jgi:hypothetical protein
MVGNKGGGCGPGPFHVLFADGGRNMQFPSGDCGSSIPVTDPRLDEFYVPLATGPATGAGDLKSCTTAPVNGVDVYGQRRPQGKGCTIGAVEGDIEDLLRPRLRGREGRRRPPRGRENDSGAVSSSRIDTILKFREAHERGDLAAARAFLASDARIWFDMAERQGPGQPWKLGEGDWERWDRFFHSETDTTDWKDWGDRVTALGHESNDYYRLHRFSFPRDARAAPRAEPLEGVRGLGAQESPGGARLPDAKGKDRSVWRPPQALACHFDRVAVCHGTSRHPSDAAAF